MAIDPEFLAALRRRYRCEMVLVLVQLEQLCPGWWLTLTELADLMGTDRATLNRSLSQLGRLKLICHKSLSNRGGTFIWWVKRHEKDAPKPEDEPAWVVRNVKSRSYERIPLTQRRQWAAKYDIPYNTLRSFLVGQQTILRERWKLSKTPLDGLMNICDDDSDGAVGAP